jgi:peptide subunit release factor RF-3
MASRKELRKPSKKNHGKRAFLEITDTIEKALGMAGPPVERAIAARTELDGMVNAARDAFVAVKAEEWFPDEEVNEAPTAEQIAMHSEVMDSLEEYFSRAPGRQVPR